MVYSLQVQKASLLRNTPLKTKMEPEKDSFQRNLLLEGSIFRFHVSFRGSRVCWKPLIFNWNFNPELNESLELQETQHVTFIDLGGMGNKTDKTDVQRLSQANTHGKKRGIWNNGGGWVGDAG